MKRTFGIVAGVLAVGVAVYVGSRLWAAPPAGAPAPGVKTRIALVNLNYVVTSYRKATNLEAEFKDTFTGYQNKAKALEAQGQALQTKIRDAKTDAASKEQAEKDLKTIQRQIQDLNDEAKEKLGKKREDQLVIIYKEVAGAVARYAQANDIDLVLHYTDAANEADMNSQANILRKMTSGVPVPMYYKPDAVDISYPVVQMLNAAYGQTNPPAGSVATPGATPGAAPQH